MTTTKEQLAARIEELIKLHFPFQCSNHLINSILLDMYNRHETDTSDDTILMYIDDNI
jgi:hypothetical protein